MVAVVLYDALVGLDANTGEVLWRRQYRGKITKAAGGMDTLGVVVFDKDALTGGRTHLYSIDPSSGDLRFRQQVSCSNGDFKAGLPGVFGLRCGRPTLIDAPTGAVTDLEGKWLPAADDEVYAGYLFRSGSASEDRSQKIVVFAPDGRIIDEFPGEYDASSPHNGYLLVFHGDNQWTIRDYRTHRSTPASLAPFVTYANIIPSRLTFVWLGDRLLVTDDGRENPILLIDAAHPTEQIRWDSPCPPGGRLQDITATRGAVVAVCDTAIVGLAPPA